MNKVRTQLLNWILIGLVMTILCGFQTTFWYQLVGGIPAPLMWLNLVLYVTLYRLRLEAILINYGLALFLLPFTSMNLGVLWATLLIITVIINYAKIRIFWPGTRYFMLASVGATLIFQLSSWTLSRLIDVNPVGLNIYSRVFELILTPLLSAPVYWMMSFIDRISEKDPLPERGAMP